MPRNVWNPVPRALHRNGVDIRFICSTKGPTKELVALEKNWLWVDLSCPRISYKTLKQIAFICMEEKDSISAEVHMLTFEETEFLFQVGKGVLGAYGAGDGARGASSVWE